MIEADDLARRTFLVVEARDGILALIIAKAGNEASEVAYVHVGTGLDRVSKILMQSETAKAEIKIIEIESDDYLRA